METSKCGIEFYSGTSEYCKIVKNGINFYFCITHIKLRNKPYAVVRGLDKELNLESYFKHLIRENETIVYENEVILENVIVKDDYHIIIVNGD